MISWRPFLVETLTELNWDPGDEDIQVRFQNIWEQSSSAISLPNFTSLQTTPKVWLLMLLFSIRKEADSLSESKIERKQAKSTGLNIHLFSEKYNAFKEVIDSAKEKWVDVMGLLQVKLFHLNTNDNNILIIRHKMITLKWND